MFTVKVFSYNSDELPVVEGIMIEECHSLSSSFDHGTNVKNVHLHDANYEKRCTFAISPRKECDVIEGIFKIIVENESGQTTHIYNQEIIS